MKTYDTLEEAVESLADFVEEMYEGCTPSRGCTGCEALLKVKTVRELLEQSVIVKHDCVADEWYGCPACRAKGREGA